MFADPASFPLNHPSICKALYSYRVANSINWHHCACYANPPIHPKTWRGWELAEIAVSPDDVRQWMRALGFDHVESRAGYLCLVGEGKSQPLYLNGQRIRSVDPAPVVFHTGAAQPRVKEKPEPIVRRDLYAGEETTVEHVVRALVTARGAKGLTQADLAKALGVSRNTITRWERTGEVSLGQLLAWSRVVGLDTFILCGLVTLGRSRTNAPEPEQMLIATPMPVDPGVCKVLIKQLIT